MPSSYSFVCCSFTKDGTGQRYFPPASYPLDMPYYPGDSFDPTPYQFRRRRVMPAIPDSYQHNSDDPTPALSQPKAHPPPVVRPPVVAHLSPPTRSRGYSESRLEPPVAIVPVTISGRRRSPPPQLQPQRAVIQTWSPPGEGSPIHSPIASVTQRRHGVDRNRHHSFLSWDLDGNFYPPSPRHRSERITVGSASSAQENPNSPQAAQLPGQMAVDSDTASYSAPSPHFRLKPIAGRPPLRKKSSQSSPSSPP